jgi:flagellar biosynthesis/type III secretory pathway M-ring protein FliF/YscJ
MLTQSFDPDGAVVTSKQSFNENLNANARQDNAGGPTSTLLPPGLTANAGSGDSRKDYDRNGQEVSYDNTKVQTYETRMPGMLEDISVAVTIDKTHFPSIPKDALQQLIARAASPKVDPNNVSVAVVDFQSPDILTNTSANDGDSEGGGMEMGWLPWAAGSVAVCVLLLVILSFIRGGRSNDSSLIEIQLAQQELQQLKELATQQQAQIQAAQQQTQMLIENQRQQIHQAPAPASLAQTPTPQSNELKQTLSELQQAVAQRKSDEEDIDLQIKSWIESS